MCVLRLHQGIWVLVDTRTGRDDRREGVADLLLLRAVMGRRLGVGRAAVNIMHGDWLLSRSRTEPGQRVGKTESARDGRKQNRQRPVNNGVLCACYNLETMVNSWLLYNARVFTTTRAYPLGQHGYIIYSALSRSVPILSIQGRVRGAGTDHALSSPLLHYPVTGELSRMGRAACIGCNILYWGWPEAWTSCPGCLAGLPLKSGRPGT